VAVSRICFKNAGVYSGWRLLPHSTRQAPFFQRDTLTASYFLSSVHFEQFIKKKHFGSFGRLCPLLSQQQYITL
jgi:hypothetical protein